MRLYDGNSCSCLVIVSIVDLVCPPTEPVVVVRPRLFIYQVEVYSFCSCSFPSVEGLNGRIVVVVVVRDIRLLDASV